MQAFNRKTWGHKYNIKKVATLEYARTQGNATVSRKDAYSEFRLNQMKTSDIT